MNLRTPLSTRISGVINNHLLLRYILKFLRLRNKYLLHKILENKNKYNQQRNCCVNLFHKIKKEYYNNHNITQITDCKELIHLVQSIKSAF